MIVFAVIQSIQIRSWARVLVEVAMYRVGIDIIL